MKNEQGGIVLGITKTTITIMADEKLMDLVPSHAKDRGENLTEFYTKAIVNQLENDGDFEVRDMFMEEKEMPKIASKKTAAPKVEMPKCQELPTEVLKVISDLNKKYGDNTIRLGVSKEKMITKRIPTGSVTLDIALGGGIPEGRFIEISGNESSTKTTQVCHIIREAQKLGYIVAFFDVEGTSDIAYFKQIGVNTDCLIYSRPDSMEEATEAMLQLQRSGYVNFGVIDSIASMIPNKEAESKMEETVRMGIPQQLLGEFLRKWQANNNRLEREGKTPFTLIGINQLREKIGVYGDPEYTPGGNAKKFFSSVNLRFRRGDWIIEGKGDNRQVVGQVVKFRIEKNKTYKRMQSGEFDFYFADNSAGVRSLFNDNFKEIIMLAVEWGVVERRGAWFYFNDNKYQGIDSLIADLKDKPEMVDSIKKQVIDLAVMVR